MRQTTPESVKAQGQDRPRRRLGADCGSYTRSLLASGQRTAHRPARERERQPVTGVNYTIKSHPHRGANRLWVRPRGVVRRSGGGGAVGPCGPRRRRRRLRALRLSAGGSLGFARPLEGMTDPGRQIGPAPRLARLLAPPRDAPRHPTRRSARHRRPPPPRTLFATSRERPS